MDNINEKRRYIFSGSLLDRLVDYLLAMDEFEPMDVLVSQLDRSGVNKMLEYIDRGVVKSLFIDSGAYSIHSQGFDKVNKGRFADINGFVDEYIEYVNALDDKIIAVAQVDHIPGVFKQPKKPEDYIESAEMSWENYLYMRPKMKSPEKLIAVQHEGESFDHLKRMVDWRGPNGEKLEYCGISPSNDRPVSEKDVYLANVYDFLKKTSQPNIHTHLFGYTSLPGLPKFPWYSVDSVSHRLRGAYAKAFTRKWGTISLSKTRDCKTRTDFPFYEACDTATLKEFTDLLAHYHLTLDQVIEDSCARTALDIVEIQQYVKEHPYKATNRSVSRKLFSLE